MTSEQIELKSNEVLSKYVQRGGVHKVFDDIMQQEHIKFKEVDVDDINFLGEITTGKNGQLYIMISKSLDNTGRRNFTIAHELGHYFLDHLKKASFLADLNNTISENNAVAHPIEREANYFATCLLMPEEKIRRAFLARLQNSRKAKDKTFLCVTPSETFGLWKGICTDFTKRYGVSEEALRYRLVKLRLAKFEFEKRSNQ